LLVIGGGIQTVQDWIALLGLTGVWGLLATAIVTVGIASAVTAGLLCLLWKYRGKVVRDHDLQLSKFAAPGFPGMSFLNALRIPHPKFRIELSGMRGVTLTLGVVALGFGLAFAFVIVATDDTPIWPESGAEYALPDLLGNKLGPDPETPGQQSQTLRVGFKDKSRLDKVVFKNMDLGKADLATSFQVIRNATTGVTGAQAYLWIGEIIIKNSSAPTLAWDNMDVGTMTLGARVDGHTQEIQFDQTIPELIIDSDRGSGTYTAQDGAVDRIILQINGTNGASIGILEIDNVDASVGAWDWDYIKAGSITMDSSNEFGNGTGINSASVTFGTGISSRQVTDTMTDTPISVR
jgi:hypothetical protein